MERRGVLDNELAVIVITRGISVLINYANRTTFHFYAVIVSVI